MAPDPLTHPDASSGGMGRIALWVAAAALLAHLGLSAGTIWSFGPINYDDPQVLEILEHKSVGDILSTPTWYAYKPVYFLSLKIDSLFGDSTVQVGHGVNWLLHGLAVFLLVLLLHDIFRSRWIAVAAGLLFAVHPAHAENVAWFAERKDVLSLVFVLWAHRAFRAGRAKGLPVAVVPALLLLFGGLTKGTVWSYAGILAVDEWLHVRAVRAAGGEASGRAAWLRLALPLLVGVGGVVLDMTVAASSGASGVDHGVSTTSLMAAMAAVHAQYVQHVLVPVGLALDYAIDPAGSWGSPLAWLGVALAVGALVLLALGIRRHSKLLAFAAAFWVFGLAPVNNIWPRTAALMADRYLYIPAIGLYVLIAVAIGRAKAARPLVLGVVVLCLGVLCELRTAAFATSESIWSDTIEKVPSSALARIQRGTDAASQRRYLPAREDAEAALALKPRPELYVRALLLKCATSHGLLGEAGTAGTRDKVLAFLDEANDASAAAMALSRNAMVRDDPGYVQSQAEIWRGQALELLGDVANARDAYRRAVALDDNNATAWLNHATMLARSRDESELAEAVHALRRARDLAPGRIDIALQLALVYGSRGDAKRALALLDRAKARHGETAELLYTRATVVLKVAQDWAEARKILRRLREVDPNHPKGTRLEADIEVAIGRARLTKGRDERDIVLLKQAVDHFDEALKVLPSHWQAHVFAGDAFAEQGRFDEARRRYREAQDIALREEWLASLVARTATLEAALRSRRAKTPEAVLRAGGIMAGALSAGVRRIDLGFAPLQDELDVLRELVPVYERDREPERSYAAELLLVAALLATGDEVSALERLRAVFGQLSESLRSTVLFDAVLVLRSVLYERQGEFELAKRDYMLLAERRPDAILPPLRQLQIELRIAEARRQVAAGHAEDKERMARARQRVKAAADAIRAFSDKHPDSEAAGLLAVQAEINLQRWIPALKRLNDLKDRFSKNPTIYRGFNAVYVAWYTQTRDRGHIQQADENLREARRLAPRDLRTAMDASQLARIAGDLKSALRSARQARELESHPHGPASRMLADLHVELGRQALEGGQMEEVKKAIKLARQVDPSRAGSWLLEGELALKSTGSNRVARAHELARKAKALEPYNSAVNVLLAKCHKGSATSAIFHIGRYRITKKIKAYPEPKRSRTIKAFEHEQERYRKQAIHDLDMALMLDPGAEDAIETRRTRKSLLASSKFDRGARLQKSRALVDKGNALRLDANWVDALYAYWEAAQLSPGSPTPHLKVAMTAVQLINTTPLDTEEGRALSAKYHRMAQDSLYAVEALDLDRRREQIFFLKGLLHHHAWRHAGKDFGEAKEVSRLASLAAFKHYVLRRKAAGLTPATDPTMGQALERIEQLDTEGK